MLLPTLSTDLDATREQYVTQVFHRLCGSILSEEHDAAAAERRLWRVPEIAAAFVSGAATEDERRRLALLVHRLRGEVAHVIDRQLDRSQLRRALAQRVADARMTFTFRPWRVTDAARYAALLGNPSVWEGLPDEYPGALTETMARDLIEISNGWSERHVVYAVESQGQPIGQVRLQFDSSEFEDAAEISYWLGTEYWGRGLATSIVSLFTAESFRQHQRLQRIFAIVLDGNAASIRVLEKAGYRWETFRYGTTVKSGQRRSSHVLGSSRRDYANLHTAMISG